MLKNNIKFLLHFKHTSNITNVRNITLLLCGMCGILNGIFHIPKYCVGVLVCKIQWNKYVKKKLWDRKCLEINVI